MSSSSSKRLVKSDGEIEALAHARVRPVLDWLLEQRLRTVRSTLLFDGVCRELIACGIPLERASLNTGQLHPQFEARTLLWDGEAGGAVELDRRHGISEDSIYLSSPIHTIHSTDRPLRRRLADPDCPRDFPILAELAAKGYSDYFMAPIHFSGRRINAIAFATRRPEGFSELDIAMLLALLPALGAVLELDLLRRTARGLLETYLGPRSGDKVLSGTIKRGDGEVIGAVLWFCDLRGFTRLSEERPLEEVTALLNDYFDQMSQAVTAKGGEILKFIGDAMLAVFPIGSGSHGMREACASALAAADAALLGVADCNRRREGQGLAPVRCGIALHVGDVLYGNVGAADRLDFTVIGPAVNLAARLEALSIGLDQPIVLSAAFAAACGRVCRSLGYHELKGVSGEQEAFTPGGA